MPIDNAVRLWVAQSCNLAGAGLGFGGPCVKVIACLLLKLRLSRGSALYAE